MPETAAARLDINASVYSLRQVRDALNRDGKTGLAMQINEQIVRLSDVVALLSDDIQYAERFA